MICHTDTSIVAGIHPISAIKKTTEAAVQDERLTNSIGAMGQFIMAAINAVTEAMTSNAMIGFIAQSSLR